MAITCGPTCTLTFVNLVPVKNSWGGGACLACIQFQDSFKPCMVPFPPPPASLPGVILECREWPNPAPKSERIAPLPQNVITAFPTNCLVHLLCTFALAPPELTTTLSPLCHSQTTLLLFFFMYVHTYFPENDCT